MATIITQVPSKRTMPNHFHIFLLVLVTSFVGIINNARKLSGVAATTRGLSESPSLSSNRDPRLKRTAIVWTTVSVLTTCEVDRLRHLVETSGGMDVWVLHAHPTLETKGKLEEVHMSQQHLNNSITRIQQWPQSTTPFYLFDNLAGTSKSSLLRFLVDHPEYDRAWIVENDMFFTGSWQDILVSESLKDDTDFLSVAINEKNGTEWEWNTLRQCTLFGQKCIDIVNTQAGWMFAKVSSRLAHSLLQDLEEGHIKGFHEAVLAPYCHLRNFTYSRIDPGHVGQLKFGHKKQEKKKDMNVAALNPQPNTLIHPVKCGAYRETPILNDLKQWARYEPSERS